MIDYLRSIFKINPKTTALKKVEKLQKGELVIRIATIQVLPPPPQSSKKKFRLHQCPHIGQNTPLPFWSTLIPKETPPAPPPPNSSEQHPPTRFGYSQQHPRVPNTKSTPRPVSENQHPQSHNSEYNIRPARFRQTPPPPSRRF